MSARSTAVSWGAVTRTLHWLSAIVMIGLLSHGWWMTHLAARDQRIWHYATHGLVAFYFALLLAMRIVWRLGEPTPAHPAASAGWEKTAAHLGHLALYAVMLALVVSGYIMWSTFGARFDPVRAPLLDYSLFGFIKIPPLYTVANRDVFQFWEGIHEKLSWAMDILVVVHIAAALRHHLVKRNDVMTRMWSGRAGTAS